MPKKDNKIWWIILIVGFFLFKGNFNFMGAVGDENEWGVSTRVFDKTTVKTNEELSVTYNVQPQPGTESWAEEWTIKERLPYNWTITDVAGGTIQKSLRLILTITGITTPSVTAKYKAPGFVLHNTYECYDGDIYWYDIAEPKFDGGFFDYVGIYAPFEEVSIKVVELKEDCGTKGCQDGVCVTSCSASCGEWGSCLDNEVTRNCIKTDCSTYEETKTCLTIDTDEPGYIQGIRQTINTYLMYIIGGLILIYLLSRRK